jgi:hypothetical protein
MGGDVRHKVTRYVTVACLGVVDRADTPPVQAFVAQLRGKRLQ